MRPPSFPLNDKRNCGGAACSESRCIGIQPAANPDVSGLQSPRLAARPEGPAVAEFRRLSSIILMALSITPESVVQRQLDAYNARDTEALMATYAEDAQQFEYPGTLLTSGAAQLRERITARFRESNLHARLLSR